MVLPQEEGIVQALVLYYTSYSFTQLDQADFCTLHNPAEILTRDRIFGSMLYDNGWTAFL
jgi:hypothetical protein